MICGLLGAESLIVNVPVTLPSVVGVKVTLMVQIAFGATGVPQVFVCANPAVTTIAPNVSGAVPVLVIVMTCGLLVDPTACEAKVTLVGEMEAAAWSAPVPVSKITCGESPALSVKVREPTLDPETVGV